MTLQQQGAAAKAAARILAAADSAQKNRALEAIAQALTERSGEWLAANAEDIAAARAAGMREAMLDRLMLSPERIAGIADGVRQVIEILGSKGVKVTEKNYGHYRHEIQNESVRFDYFRDIGNFFLGEVND